MLHITNGDAAARLIGEFIEESEGTGEVLAWRDALHEGPAPAGLSPDELREVRAGFIAERGWCDREQALALFRERDGKFLSAREHDEVVLWFEADLYDQLQLLQILDGFSRHDRGKAALTLVCVDRLPGGEIMRIGNLTPAQADALYRSRRPVPEAQLALGREGWEAFRSPDPEAVERFLAGDTSALPFLSAAMTRHLQQFPSRKGGVSRSERQILEGVAGGVHRVASLFTRSQVDQEEHPFVGDVTFAWYLERMGTGDARLVAREDGNPVVPPDGKDRFGRDFWESRVVLTDRGREVLAGKRDWIREAKGIDRWLGGVHLSGRDSAWRWDERGGRVVRWKA